VSLLVPIVGLLFLILIHEAGHFLVAKAVGARATKFYLGFPPAVLRRHVRGTEYGVGAIPLGGYVRIVGMMRPQVDDLYRVEDAAEEAALRTDAGRLDELTPAVRELSVAMRAQRFSDVPALAEAALAALEVERPNLHERTYAQAAKDLQRVAEDADPRAYWRLAVWRRIAIIFAGPGVNIAAAFLILAGFFLWGIPQLEPTRQVAAVVADSPAAQAGLRSGDEIVAVDGRRVTEAVQIRDVVQAADGRPVTLTVRRDGAERTLEPQAARRVDDRWQLGLQFGTARVGTERYGVVEATTNSVRIVGEATKATLVRLKEIAFGEGREELTTVVGIVDQSRPTVSDGSYPFVLAMISLALAIFNLLPFMPLDGGHILFALIERVRGGRPVSRGVVARVSMVGIALMLMLFFVGLSNDVTRITAP
jgi:regulator of sigma E protease